MTPTTSPTSTLAEPNLDEAFARRSAEYLLRSGLTTEQAAHILKDELGLDHETVQLVLG